MAWLAVKHSKDDDKGSSDTCEDHGETISSTKSESESPSTFRSTTIA